MSDEPVVSLEPTGAGAGSLAPPQSERPTPFADAIASLDAPEGVDIVASSSGVHATAAKTIGKGWSVAATARCAWQAACEAAAGLRWRPKK